MSESRDCLSIIEILSKIFAALVLPIILFFLGNSFNTQLKNSERLTTMLKHLSSENPREREIATKVAQFFGENNQLPKELLPVLLDIANNDSNKNVTIKVRQSLTEMAEKNPSIKQTIKGGFDPIVYIQIADEIQREKAKKVQSELRQNGFSAPGIENIKGKATIPSNMEIRYFSDEEKNQAEKIGDVLKNTIGISVVLNR